MNEPLGRLHEEFRVLKLDDSLLFLNHVLAVSRNLVNDPHTDQHLKTLPSPLPPFLIHFFAKELLLHGSNLCLRTLDWLVFRRLVDLYFEIDDPIVNDPDWTHRDPGGFFERLLSQQLPSQRQLPLRDYGLALGLFRDAGRLPHPAEYDLRVDIEQALRVPIEDFMGMGFLCSALPHATYLGHHILGTFTPMDLAEAYAEGVEFCVPENWAAFLQRVACTPEAFRELSQQPEYRVRDQRYVPFEFNALYRYPIIEVAKGRFIAVDPLLIVTRTTWREGHKIHETTCCSTWDRFGEMG